MNLITPLFSPMHKTTPEKLRLVEFCLLSLMIISLPSIEAPKNIFLVFFVLVSFVRQLRSEYTIPWKAWDSIFVLFIFTALLSCIFPGIPQGDEWKGFRVLLTYILTGWLVARAAYSQQQILWLLGFAIVGVIPPLLWGYYEYLWVHTKHDLQIHSVGHVNHSAIYLAIVFGASLSVSLGYWQKANLRNRILMVLLPVFLFVGLVVGQSRGALGVAILLAVLLLLVLNKSFKIKLAGIGLLALALVFTVFMQAGVVKKQEGLEKSDNVLSFRNQVWNVSFEACKFHPILGLGMDNWKLVKPTDIQKAIESRHEVYDPKNYLFPGHSHNIYLNTLVERGWVGLVALLVFMFYWLGYLLRGYARIFADDTEAALWGAAFSAWMITFGVGFVNTTLHHEHGILAMLMLGLYLSYTRRDLVIKRNE
jgi:O-antigen ligase